MQKGNLRVLVVSLLFCFPCAVFAETVILKSGKKIKGRILEKTDRYLRIESEAGALYYELKYIEAIEEDKPVTAVPQEEASLNGADSYLKKGLSYGAEKKFKEAEEAFRKGLEVNPADHNLREALVMVEYLKNGTIKEEFAVCLFKGSDYLINAEFNEAIAEFKKALELKPQDPDIYYYLGVCNYSLEQYQEAADYLQKAAEIRPDHEIYYYLGASHYSLGHYPEAITCLEKTLETNPDDAEAYSIIGTSNYLLKRFARAREDLNKAKEIFRKRGDYLRVKEVDDFLKSID